MYWTEAWVAILTAGLAYTIWRLLLLARELREGLDAHGVDIEALRGGKADIRPTRPRACFVLALFHERDAEGREIWLCTKCGASVPMKGHTVKACEEWRAEVARVEQEQIAEALKESV